MVIYFALPLNTYTYFLIMALIDIDFSELMETLRVVVDDIHAIREELRDYKNDMEQTIIDIQTELRIMENRDD